MAVFTQEDAKLLTTAYKQLKGQLYIYTGAYYNKQKGKVEGIIRPLQEHEIAKQAGNLELTFGPDTYATWVKDMGGFKVTAFRNYLYNKVNARLDKQVHDLKLKVSKLQAKKLTELIKEQVPKIIVDYVKDPKVQYVVFNRVESKFELRKDQIDSTIVGISDLLENQPKSSGLVGLYPKLMNGGKPTKAELESLALQLTIRFSDHFDN